ncbi:MAG: PAS domain S-box protein [Desulfomicrobium sp.]|nr:PAS domain S-box protein [Pseudomonadota bacterium]MBV1713424.1 PAS domain S-box protein [Desulfomicrobium sp.]MBU4570442.1 PAS domain S-box protein [Pseudomonadota bacterium]MBU4593799.1 PAS domain S-box protein [Pseudomonadota bacterium]MBV1719747.1 PAS domain S-box protein [Desulfomicrobium sp.]
MTKKYSRKPKKPASAASNAQALRKPSLYVAVGASAGGLEAIEAFFSGMASDSGMAFIVIQHLSPDYKSLMVEILSKKTSMKVHRAEDGMPVLPDNVYLIPPKKNLTIFHGKLLLNDQEHVKGIINLPIDIFIRSLAEDQGDKAVAVILSGSGSDGMRGVRAIKEFGGMVMVQSENSAKFDSMPRAAISTGLVDFILPPEEMPERLLSYAKHPFVIKAERSETVISDEDALTRIFAILRDKFKADFTYYKPSTVTRRIERRMSINRIDEIRDYVAYMQHYPGEAGTLFREFLIGVTRFFRDREVFDSLKEKWLPEVLDRAAGKESRFWIAGCSTGEEAYTLAILAKEYMLQAGINRDLKIFATDIDRDAVLFAANGIYPESIAADVPQELLAKYFYRKQESYQISRNIREMVVFAQHNLIKDPPFTNIDLISCRNLLIYLQPVLQRKVLEFFNFSLTAKGVLLLGTSETIGEMGDCFESLDHKYKIYRTKGRFKHSLDSSDLPQVPGAKYRDIGSRFPALRRETSSGDERILERFLEALSAELFQLAVVVNEQMEVLHVFGDTTGYFKLPSGKLSRDISKMAARDLAIPLSTGIQKVFRKQEALRFSNIKLRDLDTLKIVDLRILPLPQKKGQEPLAAVFLEEVNRPDVLDKNQTIQAYDLSMEAEQRISDLEQELQFTRENLQATVEELETANEELQATNEELLASNEELQSTNEELQSTNEELYSVNSEYQTKIVELSELHNDVDNLLSVSQIGKLLLDENMEIRRFSPKVADIFKVLDTDIGRPLSHISHLLDDVDPVRIIEKVQKLGKMTEHEVRTRDGHWFLMRVVPYSVGPKVFSGTLVSFVDITRIKHGEEALRASEEEFRTLFETLPLGVVYHAAEGSIISANPAAAQILGLTFDQLLGKTSMDPRWRMIREDGTNVPGHHHPAMIALRTGHQEGPVVRGVFHPDMNTHIWLSITATPLFKPGNGTSHQVYAIFEDITEKRRVEQDYQVLFRQMFNGFSVHDIICDEKGHPVDYRFLAVNPAFERITGLRGDVILGRTVLEILPGTEKAWIESCGHVALTGNPARFEHYSSDLGKYFQVSVFQPALGQFACIFAEIECSEACAKPASAPDQDS